MQRIMSGVSAAVLTPRSESGELNLPEFRRELEFLMHRGITNFAFNGATGEFCLTSPAEMNVLLSAATETIAGQAEFVVGIGAASYQTAIELGAMAKKAGARSVLLPMPYFFPYSQDDLNVFSRTVAAGVDLPVLLYDLPQFTSGLEPATILELIRSCENIVGVKDSSGSLETLRLLTASGIPCCRLVGNDAVIVDALREGICDGVISGVACALPELIQAVFQATSGQESQRTEELKAILDTVLDRLNALPVPWGLKAISGLRKITQSAFCQPLSASRRTQLKEFGQWFTENSEMLLATGDSSQSSIQ
jgi:4-hydroxy-tetrahydrodipicolinate synthase